LPFSFIPGLGLSREPGYAAPNSQTIAPGADPGASKSDRQLLAYQQAPTTSSPRSNCKSMTGWTTPTGLVWSRRPL